MNKYTLPRPKTDAEKFKSLTDLLTATINHGKACPDTEVYQAQYVDLYSELRGTFTQDISFDMENETKGDTPMQIRPSANLSCQGIGHFLHKRTPTAPIPPSVRSVLRMGHTLHAETYAALISALPDGGRALIEVRVDMPDWWPHHLEYARKKGTIDIILYLDDDFITGYFAESVRDTIPRKIVCDVKSTSFWGFKKMVNADYTDPEVGNDFGYISQLMIYSDVEGTTEAGAILIGVDRSSPGNPPCVQHIPGDRLIIEREAVQRRLADDVEWSPEKFLKDYKPESKAQKQKTDFVCGSWIKGQEGFCKYSKQCMVERQRAGYIR